jgi:hypothetical protein
MRTIKLITLVATALAVSAFVYQPSTNRLDIPNRLPEAAPYNVAEAQAFPPPYEEFWQTHNHPGQCASCHQKIFDEWNGSMMSNSWRDPVWRAAFFLLTRGTSTNGDCAIKTPPDGTPKAHLNPFAKPGECASEFDIGTHKYTVARSGSLLDGFCSRCHMPTNYIDNIPLRTVKVDPNTGLENAPVDPKFDPTSDNGTGIAYAELASQFRNTDSGRTGIFCAICHTFASTRDTPWHNYARGGNEYNPAVGTEPRSSLLAANLQDMFNVADPTKRNLGYSIGAGAYRLSPHAIGFPERFGPMAANEPPVPLDVNTSTVFGQNIAYQQADQAKHRSFHNAMFVRSEMCAACHDVTNALPIKNTLGRWVGGFPIERTYTEWTNSRYADRPGNANFDPHFKRDCQSCHMQQEYGQPGTANTLYQSGHPLPIPNEPVALDGKPRPFFSHHFVGGNAFVPRLIGKDVDQTGSLSPWPELSAFSFSSADHKSPYSRGFWTHTERKGAYAQQQRMAWDRLRHVLSMDVTGPERAEPGSQAPITITVANTGSGHNFPTGFPEGRIAWLAVHAYDLSTGKELPINDSFWKRVSPTGIGNLTTEEVVDPNFPNCNWELPPASADPYSIQFKAVASLGNGCPTLDLPYATPLNLTVNKDNLPTDQEGRVIDASFNPKGMPQFRDVNGNGDFFDDSYLRDSRFKPMPLPEATKKVDRYSVVIPPGTKGPIAVTATMYYQSVEAIVAQKFLGNMVDTNENFVLEPCVLGGLCDGRKPTTEPAVVEGAPPVPMVVRNLTVTVGAAPADRSTPKVATYPLPGAARAYQDTVVKASFSRPVRGVDTRNFTLTDAHGAEVPAWVDQIGDGTFGLFPNQILLKGGETYTARLKGGICDATGSCTAGDVVWSFTVTTDPEQGAGDTSVPAGFSVASPASGLVARAVPAVEREKRPGKHRLAMHTASSKVSKQSKRKPSHRR